MTTVKATPSSRSAHERITWVEDTMRLMNHVKLWASEAGWELHEENAILTEMGVGTYTVPVLTVITPAGRLTVTPIALRTPEFDGRVDILGYPSLARMVLMRERDGDHAVWHLRTNDDMDWPQPWGHEAFRQIAGGLLRVR